MTNGPGNGPPGNGYPVPASGLGACVSTFTGAPSGLAQDLVARCVKTVRLVVYTYETNYQSKLLNDLAICGQNGLIPFVTLEDHPASWSEPRFLDAVEWVHNQGVALGIWNEPNSSNFFSGSVYDYANLWTAACGRIGTVPIGPQLASHQNMFVWLQSWWNLIPSGLRPGIVSIHFYNDAAWMGSYIQQTFNIVGWDRQLWITEHGMADPENDPNIRRTHLEDSLVACDTYPNVNMIMPWHTYTPADSVILDALDVYCHR